MKITAVKREAGKWTFFDVALSSGEGKEPFLTLKDCKIMEGSKGQFVSFPARKDEAAKWWPMVYGSDAFQVECIKAMNAAQPKPAAALADHDDIPF